MFRLLSAAFAALFSLATILVVTAGPVLAQAHSDRVQAANNDTVSVISGGIGGTYIRIAADLQAELDDIDNLRILPIVGKGSIKNIEDLLYLRGVDIAIVQCGANIRHAFRCGATFTLSGNDRNGSVENFFVRVRNVGDFDIVGTKPSADMTLPAAVQSGDPHTHPIVRANNVSRSTSPQQQKRGTLDAGVL